VPEPLARLLSPNEGVVGVAASLFAVTAVFQISDGVQGVGAGWGVGLDGRPWWPGEPDRWLGQAPAGWSHL
jgi:hypothetical protein